MNEQAAHDRARRGASGANPMPGGQPARAAAGTIGLQDVLATLRRWWWQSLAAGLLLTAASCAVVWFTFKPSYDARALLKIQDRSPYIVFEHQNNSTVFSQTELETIRSPYVLEKVAASREVEALPEAREAQAKDHSLMAWLLKNLKINYIGRSELCEIHFKAYDPAAAATVANSVMDAYLSLHRDGTGEQTERIIDLLMEEQRNRKAELKQLQERVRIITKKATGKEPVFMAGARDMVVQQNPLSSLEDRLASTEVERAVLEARLKALEEAAEQDEIEVPPGVLSKSLESHPEIARLQQEVRVKRAQLRSYQDKKPESGVSDTLLATITRLEAEVKSREEAVEKAKAQIEPEVTAELKSLLIAQRKDDIDMLREDLKDQKLLEETWRGRLTEQQTKYEKLGDDAVDLEFARTELQRADEVYRKIADRIVVLRTERRAPARAEALVRATPPPLPVEKLPWKLFGMALVGSFAAPLGLALLQDRRLRRVCDAEQVAAETNLEVLGEIAALPTRLALANKASERLARERLAFEESVDALRAGLTLSPLMRNCQVLVVTSAVSREGKTSLASSLAVSLARNVRQPVLLIDADMRAPDLHEIFEVPLSPGLADVLNNKCEANEAIVAQPDQGIHVLPAGRLTGSPHATMRHGEFSAALERLRPAYRYIVVDAPPVLAASEAMTIAAAGDGTLVCAMRELSRGPQLRLACNRLTTAGANLVGAVISGVPHRDWQYRYGYYGYDSDRFLPTADEHGDHIN